MSIASQQEGIGMYYFCFQAEDGIRYWSVTGVQTCVFFFSSRRRHTRLVSDWSSDVCSSDLGSRGCCLPQGPNGKVQRRAARTGEKPVVIGFAGAGCGIPLAAPPYSLRAAGTYCAFVRKLVASFFAILTPSCHQVPRDFQIGANGGGGHTPDVTAIRALRMQKDQLQVGHTIHPSDSGRQASERSPCCHKESVAAYP